MGKAERGWLLPLQKSIKVSLGTRKYLDTHIGVLLNCKKIIWAQRCSQTKQSVMGVKTPHVDWILQSDWCWIFSKSITPMFEKQAKLCQYVHSVCKLFFYNITIILYMYVSKMSCILKLYQLKAGSICNLPPLKTLWSRTRTWSALRAAAITFGCFASVVLTGLAKDLGRHALGSSHEVNDQQARILWREETMTVGRNRSSYLGHIWVPKKGHLKGEKSHWYSPSSTNSYNFDCNGQKIHTHTTGIYRYGHWLQQQLGFLLMLGAMTGCWDSHRYVRLIVLGVEFFHAGIGDLFSAMLQSTSTTVIDLG